MKNRNFDPGDPIPAGWTDAIQEHISGIGSASFGVRIKPGAANTLQVPAGTGDDQVAIPIEGRWRYVTAPVEVAGSGAARTVDVWVTAADNVFLAGSPGEVDNTDYSFAPAIRDVGSPPTGVALMRRVAQAVWDGSVFTDVAALVAGVLAVPGQPGDIKATGRATAPLGWLLCDGSPVSRATYSTLFAVLGTTFGPGNGSTTFNLPDLRGRVPVGEDGAAARLAANDARGQSGGEEKHQLTIAEMASHFHTIGYSGVGYTAGAQSGTIPDASPSGTYASGAVGGDAAHNNMQPYQVVNWCVKA